MSEGWTDERVAALTRYWREGLSCSQIANRLGGGATRNSVIGKATRLGLTGRAPASRPTRFRAAPAPKPAPVAKPPRLPPAPKPAPVAALPRKSATPFQALPGTTPRRIESLGGGMCRWPIGDAADGSQQLFCAAPTTDGLSWCADHQALGHTPFGSSVRGGDPWADKLARFVRGRDRLGPVAA
jgi:GcrA cell cycle regulator